MIKPSGPLDGAQRRGYVLGQLEYFGVKVGEVEPGLFELEDMEGDVEVLYIDDPILSRMVTYLWRRFGQLHGMLPQDLVEKHRVH